MMLTDERIREIADQHSDPALKVLTKRASSRRVESAIRQALAEAQEWRDMESAPKTGLLEYGAGIWKTMILGFAPDEEGYSPKSREGFWNPRLQRWSSVSDPEWTSSPQPTHWKPLPLPPFGPTVDKGEG